MINISEMEPIIVSRTLWSLSKM